MEARKFLIVENDISNLVYNFLKENGFYVRNASEKEETFPALIVSQKPKNKEMLAYKDILMNTNNKTVYIHNEEIMLTATEYKILELLLRHPQKTFSKKNLFESIWNEEYLGDENIMNAHMSNLRNKLKRKNPLEKYIETVWGIGYRLYK